MLSNKNPNDRLPSYNLIVFSSVSFSWKEFSSYTNTRWYALIEQEWWSIENSLSMETMRVFHTMILHQSFQHLRHLSLQSMRPWSRSFNRYKSDIQRIVSVCRCYRIISILPSPRTQYQQYIPLFMENTIDNSINDEGLQELFEALDRRCYSSLLSLHLSSMSIVLRR